MPQIRRSTYLLTVLTFGFFVLSLLWHPAPPPNFVGIRSAEVPVQIGDWTSKGDYEVTPQVRDALASADIVSRTYEGNSSAAGSVDFILIGGTDRNALHDPRSCLVGAGWRLDNDHVEPLPKSGVEARACEAIGQPGGTDFDIVYLYDVDGQIRNKVTEIRAEMLLSALIGRKNRPVYFLRLMIPLAKDPATREANHKELVDFADSAWQALAPRLGTHGSNISQSLN